MDVREVREGPLGVCLHQRVIYAEVDIFGRLEQGARKAHSSLVRLF